MNPALHPFVGLAFAVAADQFDLQVVQGAELAKQHAEGEFAKYRVLEDARFESDFDRMVKSLPAPKDQPE